MDKGDLLEKYRLYLVFATINNKRGYTVVDTDHDSDILLAHHQKILVFSSKTLLSYYLLNYQTVFRKDRAKKWIRVLEAYPEPYASIDLNLRFYISGPLKRKQEDTLMTTIGFIEDFAYQTDNKKLFKLLSHRMIKQYRELHWNQYLWKPTDDKDRLNDLPKKEIRQALERLAFEMKSHILVCNKANALQWQTK